MNIALLNKLLKSKHADVFYQKNKELLDELAFLIGAEQQDMEGKKL
jgi:hypothetical protein